MTARCTEEQEEDIIECCGVELIRDTFRQLNCGIVYLNELVSTPKHRSAVGVERRDLALPTLLRFWISEGVTQAKS